MYKVVIIDDEPIIVEGLSRIVPWHKYDCEVVGSAQDGQEALELIRELEPDIVFSDIYMPKMDGLMLAAALKSEYEDMELSILTGYRDFDLLQKALILGVTRFILKPSNMQELEEAVQAMTDRLKKKGILPESSEEEKADSEQKNEAGSFLVNRAIEYIHMNYTKKMSLQDVADHIYVSKWHLSKLLNRHTGKSFSELLNSVRIEQAKKMLENPALRIGDIADAVGFMDIAHFSRVFKKMTGMSANEYRNKLK